MYNKGETVEITDLNELQYSRLGIIREVRNDLGEPVPYIIALNRPRADGSYGAMLTESGFTKYNPDRFKTNSLDKLLTCNLDEDVWFINPIYGATGRDNPILDKKRLQQGTVIGLSMGVSGIVRVIIKGLHEKKYEGDQILFSNDVDQALLITDTYNATLHHDGYRNWKDRITHNPELAFKTPYLLKFPFHKEEEYLYLRSDSEHISIENPTIVGCTFEIPGKDADCVQYQILNGVERLSITHEEMIASTEMDAKPYSIESWRVD